MSEMACKPPVDTYSFGASVAALFYTLFPDNPVVLPILGWFFSLPCFYVITQMPDYSQAGRFTLLAYVSHTDISSHADVSSESDMSLRVS